MVQLLPDRFRSVSKDSPGREALVAGDQRVTYGELARQARAGAGFLASRIEKGDRVALVMENSPEYVAACYGTWMAGGVVVGLNPAMKGSKLLQLLRHSRTRCLFLDRRHPDAHELTEGLKGRAEVVAVSLGEGLARGPEIAAPPPLEARELATIVYTSGTTGHPKGVMLSHGSLAANIESIIQSLPLRPDDRAICVLPFQYSYGASVLHTHLVMGAALVLERSFMYPHLVVEHMAREKVTSLAGVPSTFRLLMRRTDLSAFDLSTLRYVTVAGGPLPAPQIQAFLELVPHTEFFVMYGQTEAAPRLSCARVGDGVAPPGTAGRAVPGVELRIRDASGSDLPPGREGEVCARGDNLMLGYWADPQETREVLRDGWLHTGDLGHLDRDGFLFLRGRLREMIKSGAHRIAPGEIEEVIREVPGVRDVAVIGADDDLLGQVPLAFVIPSQKEDSLRRAILHACQRRLARFKVPRDVVFRQEFPRTGSGKVRRHLLHPGDFHPNP